MPSGIRIHWLLPDRYAVREALVDTLKRAPL
jgi:hypothetical protein